MALPAFKKPKINFVFLAFLAPFLGMCIVMAIRGFIPFGETSMLYSEAVTVCFTAGPLVWAWTIWA